MLLLLFDAHSRSHEDQAYLVILPEWAERVLGPVTHGDTYEGAVSMDRRHRSARCLSSHLRWRVTRLCSGHGALALSERGHVRALRRVVSSSGADRARC